jgi:hypothetical protein
MKWLDTDFASRVEGIVLENLKQDREDTFQLDLCSLFTVHTVQGGLEMFTVLIGKDYDAYDLLEYGKEAVKNGETEADTIALVTTGKATPIGGGYPRRVRLLVVANRDQMVSVLRFQDEPDEVVFDEGSATGALQEAIADFFA